MIELVRVEIDEHRKHNYVLTFIDRCGVKRELRVLKSELLKSQKIQNSIINLGGLPIHDLDAQLQSIFDATELPIIKITTMGGWHANQLVTPFGVNPWIVEDHDNLDIPHRLSERTGVIRARVEQGTSKQPIADLKQPMKSSRFLRLALLCALLPPLATRIGLTGGYVINISEGSKKQRLLMLRLAMSVVGTGGQSGLVSLDDTKWLKPSARLAYGGSCVSFKTPSSDEKVTTKIRNRIRKLASQNTGRGERDTLPAFAIQLTETPISLGEHVSDIASAIIDIEIGAEASFCSVSANGSVDVLEDEVELAITANEAVLIGPWVECICDYDSNELKIRFDQETEKFKNLITAYTHQSGTKSNASIHEQSRIAAMLCAAGALAKDLLDLGDEELIEAAALIVVNKTKIGEKKRSIYELGHGCEYFFRGIFNFQKVEIAIKANEIYCLNGFIRSEDSIDYIYVRKSFLEYCSINKYLFQKYYLPEFERNKITKKMSGGWTSQHEQLGIPGNPRYYKFDKDKLYNYIKNHHEKSFYKNVFSDELAFEAFENLIEETINNNKKKI